MKEKGHLNEITPALFILFVFTVLSYIFSFYDKERISFIFLMAASPILSIILIAIFAYVLIHRKRYERKTLIIFYAIWILTFILILIPLVFLVTGMLELWGFT